MISVNKGTGNRIANKRSETDNEEIRAVADADLLDVADLRDARGDHGHKSAAGEADDGGEGDDLRVGVAGEPEAEDEDGAGDGGEEDGVEAADFVGEDARGDTAEEAGGGGLVCGREKRWGRGKGMYLAALRMESR